MVLVLDNTTSTSLSSTMKRASDVAAKSIDEGPKRLAPSLLVDYSKRKAAVNTQQKKDLLRCKSSVDTIEDALSLTSSICAQTADDDDDDSEAAAFNESFALDDVRPVSFRVRRSSIKRSKSLDERQISSYDHLQNSIRCALLMKEETETEEKKEEAEEAPPTKEESRHPTPDQRRSTMPTSTTLNRREQLANVRRKHQSMKNLVTRQQSLRNLNSTTTACAPASTAPGMPHSPTPPVPRRTRNLNNRGDSLSKSLHNGSANGDSADIDARIAALVHTKCKSCRNLMRRCKSLQESTSTLNTSISMLHGGGSLHGSSEHSCTPVPTPTRVSPRRSSTAGPYYGKRGSLALMKAQTLSRRHLLHESSMHHHMAMMDDESITSRRGSIIMNDSTIFCTGSRIRRLDTN